MLSKMQILLLALIIGAASASMLNPDAIVPEGMEEQLPSHVRPASREEEAFLEQHAGSSDKAVLLPSEVFSQIPTCCMAHTSALPSKPNSVGRDFLNGNANLRIPTRHERAGWLCWETNPGTKCAPRNAKNEGRAAAHHKMNHALRGLKAERASKSAKEAKLKVRARAKAEHRAKEQRKKKLKELRQKMMASAKIHCKKTSVSCKKKKERLVKAQEKNQKLSQQEAKAKTEMKLAAQEKKKHEKLIETHEKRHAKLKVLAKAKRERLTKSQENIHKLSAKEALAKKEMKAALKEKKLHEKKMEIHNKTRSKLAKLAKLKYARLMKAQEKAKKLTAREAKSKAEIAHAYKSAKKENQKAAA